MKTIKILETIRQGQIGGGESHMLELVTNINKEQFEPIVLSFTDGPMIDELARRNIKTKVIPTTKAFDFRIWKQVRDFIKAEKIDIIHAHGTRANSNVFWAAKMLKIPLIYTVHGWSFHIDQKFYIRRIRELSEGFLTSMADKTICVSKSNQFDGIEKFDLKRSSVIYNAVNLNKFNPQNQFKNIRAELNISPNKTVIGFIARITSQKDPFTMLKAMEIVAKKSNDIVLLIVGDGDLKEQTVEMAQKLKITNKVIFQPFRTDIPDVLNAIDIYCLPSLWEGFPIGILEAMAMKKCVIASSVDGTRELVDNGHTGLWVENKNAAKLAEAILLLKKDNDLRNLLANNAYNYVKVNFGINRLISEVENIYNQFLPQNTIFKNSY